MISKSTRRHGWQRPLHPLQIVGIAMYSFLVVVFYTFLGLFLGNRIAEITVTSLFSFAALSVMLLFIRCTAIDPSDKTSSKKKRKPKSNGLSKLNRRVILSQIIVRFFKRIERKILRTFIRRKYLDPWKTSPTMEPLLPFPLVVKDDSIAPDTNEDDISFCALCDFEVKKHSKHCRACNRCVEGFDHHCRWLNNCVGKKNYTTFILLMMFVLLMLAIEAGTCIAIFVRCFTDTKGLEQELKMRLCIDFPREVLATISVVLFLLTAYSLAAMGQLFFFHLVLIRKGIRTYDYILAMKEESLNMELDSLDSDFSSDDSDDEFDSPEKSTFVSRFICKGHPLTQNPSRLSIRIDKDDNNNSPTTLSKKQGFHVSIDPWKLLKLSSEKALLAAEKARERLMNQNPAMDYNSLKPLPLETKSGPTTSNPERNPVVAKDRFSLPPLISKARTGSPGWLSSPRRRFSGSPTTLTGAVAAASPKQKYKSSFDLKLTEVSRELETYISKQVLCAVLKNDNGSEASPG